MILTHIAAFVAGAVFGIIIMAIFAAGKDDKSD